jgi:hypothetical protein
MTSGHAMTLGGKRFQFLFVNFDPAPKSIKFNDFQIFDPYP